MKELKIKTQSGKSVCIIYNQQKLHNQNVKLAPNILEENVRRSKRKKIGKRLEQMIHQRKYSKGWLMYQKTLNLINKQGMQTKIKNALKCHY